MVLYSMTDSEALTSAPLTRQRSKQRKKMNTKIPDPTALSKIVSPKVVSPMVKTLTSTRSRRSTRSRKRYANIASM